MKKTVKYDIYDFEKLAADIQDLNGTDVVDPLAPVRYVCCYWADHIIKLDGKNASATINFLKEHVLYWLEAYSLLGKVPVAILAIQKLQQLTVIY